MARNIHRYQTAQPNLSLTYKDELNQEIVLLLESDGRMSFSEIAQVLHVSEDTIRNRVTRMKKAGALRFTTVVDSAGAEYRLSIMLNIKVAREHSLTKLVARLGTQSSVVHILQITGRYDLIVELAVDSREALTEFLDHYIYEFDDIADSEVLSGLKNSKNQFLLKSSKKDSDAQ